MIGPSDPYPFAGRYLDLEGNRCHVLDEGSGEPVVMVHGNPTWSFYYRRLVLALRATHRVIAPDHIGCGRSDKPDDDHYQYTLSRRVADLDRVISALEPTKPVNLIVHDWGGMIGLAWAVRHPDKVSTLVVMNSAAFPLPSGTAFPRALTVARLPVLGAVLVRGLNAFSRGAVRHCVTRGRMPPEIARGYLEPYDSWHNRIAVHRFVQDIPLTPQDTAWSLLSETAASLGSLVDKPMMILWGMRDFVFDASFLAEWERRFPQASVHRFSDAGHFVLEDAFDEIGPLITAFLDR